MFLLKLSFLYILLKTTSYSLFKCHQLLAGVLEEDLSPLGITDLMKGKGMLNLKGRLDTRITTINKMRK